jgi:hypothetical protein
MNIEELTLKQIRELQNLFMPKIADSHPYPVGENVMVRTVTMIQVGRLERVLEHELVLQDAAWVADTGRFAEFLVDGAVNEVEPFPAGEVIIGRGAIIDCCRWPHALLRAVK